MSRRPNRTRRVTEAKVRAELAEYDEHLSENIQRVLSVYHAKHVAPVQEWAALPWWKRLWRGP